MSTVIRYRVCCYCDIGTPMPQGFCNGCGTRFREDIEPQSNNPDATGYESSLAYPTQAALADGIALAEHLGAYATNLPLRYLQDVLGGIEGWNRFIAGTDTAFEGKPGDWFYRGGGSVPSFHGPWGPEDAQFRYMMLFSPTRH